MMINLAVIGCGHWGPNFIRNFSQIKGVKVKYACDLSSEKLSRIRETYPDIITLHNYKQILEDKNIVAAVVATPANTHYRIAKEFLSFNKHLLVEKPIATDISDAEELIKIAEHNKIILMVGHTFKFNPGINKLKWLIKTKKLGHIYYMYSRRTNLGPLRKDVNAMWDLAPHDISIISYLLDKDPMDVTARGKKFLEHDLEDVVFMTLSYPTNIFVHIQVSWLDPRKVREITVVGSKKMAIFDDLDTKEPVRVYDKSVAKKHFKQDYSTFKEFQMIIKDGKTHSPYVRFREPLKVECEHFINCIRKKVSPLTDGRDGLSVLKVMKALQESLNKDGERVKLGRL
jgi:predicted dehydrogenase